MAKTPLRVKYKNRRKRTTFLGRRLDYYWYCVGVKNDGEKCTIHGTIDGSRDGELKSIEYAHLHDGKDNHTVVVAHKKFGPIGPLYTFKKPRR